MALNDTQKEKKKKRVMTRCKITEDTDVSLICCLVRPEWTNMPVGTQMGPMYVCYTMRVLGMKSAAVK